MIVDDITCVELVELVTDYLEGTLSAPDHERFEAHLEVCRACVTYVDQMRQTILATGTIGTDTIDSAARDELIGAFRDWNRRQS